MVLFSVKVIFHRNLANATRIRKNYSDKKIRKNYQSLEEIVKQIV